MRGTRKKRAVIVKAGIYRQEYQVPLDWDQPTAQATVTAKFLEAFPNVAPENVQVFYNPAFPAEGAN